jgi:hypothetical protein
MLARTPRKADLVQGIHVIPHGRRLQVEEDGMLSEMSIVHLH